MSEKINSFKSLWEKAKQAFKMSIKDKNSLIGLIAIISFMFCYIIFYNGEPFIGRDLSVLTAGFLLVLSLILLLIFYYNLYKQSQKFVLGLVCFISFLFIVWLYSTTKDSNILSGGFTFILIIITAWYAGIMKEQSVIMQKQMSLSIDEKKGRNVAEISRSIFSPIQNQLTKLQKIVKHGSYIDHSLDNRFNSQLEDNSPIKYLKGSVIIIPEDFDPQSKSRLRTTDAESLLKYDEEILAKKFPEIRNKIIHYQNLVKELKDVFKVIEKRLIFDSLEFQKFCQEFNSQEIQFSSQEYLKMLEYTLANTVSIPFPNRITAIGGKSYVIFIQDNQKNLLKRIASSSTKEDLFHLNKIQEEILCVINDLSCLINELLLGWKNKYNLTDFELHIADI